MKTKTASVLRTIAVLCLTATLFACAGDPMKGPHPYVLMRTSMGDILMELDRERAPISVDSFLKYVKEKHYDGTIMHRVIAGFVIQGGGFDTAYNERPNRNPIPLEANNGLSNLRGTLAMAREAEPNTATSEFYINLIDNIKLNPHPENPARKWGYAVFGHVVSGMDVVDKIATVQTGTVGPFEQDAPLTPVVITSIRAVHAPRN